MRLVNHSIDQSEEEPHPLKAVFEKDGERYTVHFKSVQRTTRPSAHSPFPGPSKGDWYAWPVEEIPDELVFEVESQEDLNEANAELGLGCEIGGIYFIDGPYHEVSSKESPFRQILV